MKPFVTMLLLFTSVFSFAQNVGINIANPSERFHIQDDSSTTLLLRTSSGTSFFSADSPSNSGLLFRSSGTDRGLIFYSPFSNSLSAAIGLNGWTLSSNGDFRVKERVYSLDDLRLDAEESVTIEANGALIKIDPSGNIIIQGQNVSITAQENLDIMANNININAANALQVSSGAGSTLAAGNGININALNDVAINSGGDFKVVSDKLDIDVENGADIKSNSGFVVSSRSLTVDTDLTAIFTIGTGFAISSGSDLSLNVGSNFGLNVEKNYDLNILQNYDLNAFSISSQASSTMKLLGTIIRFNNGNTGFAMKGDSVSTSGGTGSITSGSSQVFGN